MGFIFSKPANKKTKNYDDCKQLCWDSIKNPLQIGFAKNKYKEVAGNPELQIDIDSFVYRLKEKKEILTIGCSNCEFPCTNNCMTILVFNETKTRWLDSGYTVYAFKDWTAANLYLDAFYPDRTTLNYNQSFTKQNGWEEISDNINKGIIDSRSGLTTGKQAFNYIKKLYTKS
jgi:hypothetical protein